MFAAWAGEHGVGLGTWPDWVAAVGTSVAILIAAITYAADAKRRRWAQARLVYSYVSHHNEYEPGQVIKMRSPSIFTTDVADTQWRGPNDVDLTILKRAIEVTIAVHNGSKEIIGPIRARLTGVETTEGALFQQVSVPPESTIEFTIYLENPVPGGSPAIGSAVAFRDSVGRWWRRYQAEPIERLTGNDIPD